jgi:deoxycytidine triphosphate deaminase/intein/homing endonuclease
MSIKSDHWIRRQAAAGMIEPFEPGQVRSVDGRKIVSYGTSSYGYDVRCANEFKIFTNINSTIVDPKAFDPQSFVDITADVCIIPPNSFALARTVEYFRIPRSTLVVCLGKCVTGDTRVVDADTGAYLPITEMRFGRKTLAMDGWELRPAAVSEFMRQGRKPVFELRTRAGLRIRATANHPFRQFGGWTALENLKVGDRIAAARQIPVFGRTPLPAWEASLLGMMIAEGQCNTPGHSPVFTSEDPVQVELLRACVRDGGLGEVTHNGHFGYRLVNHAGRGGIPEGNRATHWLKGYGLNVGSADKFVPQAVFMAPRESVQLFLQALFAGDGGLFLAADSAYLEYYSKSRRLVEDVQHLLLRFGVLGVLREKTTSIGTRACSVQITDFDQIRRFAERVGFVPGSIKQKRLENEVAPVIARGSLKSNFDTLPRDAWGEIRNAAARAGVSLNSMGVHANSRQSVPMKAARVVSSATRDAEISSLLEGPLWDVVESVTPVGDEEVFDISVPRVHNFVANGLIVHNSTYARCGIICNVTPLEPEWEGHVTLEFSNTTPLPAKIYANEGVAQMLFFESDEVCETSYKDRGGKYQGQRGVTLPKT